MPPYHECDKPSPYVPHSLGRRHRVVCENRALWDRLIRRGLEALERAEKLSRALGPYALQAAIAACAARALTRDQTDWERIAALYDALAQLLQSPVVELNRAVAIAMALGPAAGMELIEPLTSEPSRKGYHLLPSARGDPVFKIGRFSEAREELGVQQGLRETQESSSCSSVVPQRAQVALGRRRHDKESSRLHDR